MIVLSFDRLRFNYTKATESYQPQVQKVSHQWTSQQAEPYPPGFQEYSFQICSFLLQQQQGQGPPSLVSKPHHHLQVQQQQSQMMLRNQP